MSSIYDLKYLGEGIWYLPYNDYDTDHLRINLPAFKKNHPRLRILSITPDIDHGRVEGWIVDTEEKED